MQNTDASVSAIKHTIHHPSFNSWTSILLELKQIVLKGLVQCFSTDCNAQVISLKAWKHFGADSCCHFRKTENRLHKQSSVGPGPTTASTTFQRHSFAAATFGAGRFWKWKRFKNFKRNNANFFRFKSIMTYCNIEITYLGSCAEIRYLGALLPDPAQLLPPNNCK